MRNDGWWALCWVATSLCGCGESSDAAGAGGAASMGGAATQAGSASTAGAPTSGGGASGATAMAGATAIAGTATGGATTSVVTPTCELGVTHFQGVLAGQAYMGGGPPSDWNPTKISFGVGQTSGSAFGLECELTFGQKLTVGAKVPISNGFLYVQGTHPLAGKYVCVKAGEISLVKAPPASESVLIEFNLTSAMIGQYCDGAPVDLALAGCISRTSTYVP